MILMPAVCLLMLGQLVEGIEVREVSGNILVVALCEISNMHELLVAFRRGLHVHI